MTVTKQWLLIASALALLSVQFSACAGSSLAAVVLPPEPINRSRSHRIHAVFMCLTYSPYNVKEHFPQIPKRKQVTQNHDPPAQHSDARTRLTTVTKGRRWSNRETQGNAQLHT